MSYAQRLEKIEKEGEEAASLLEAAVCLHYYENPSAATHAQLMDSGGVYDVIKWRGVTLGHPLTHELERIARFQARPSDIFLTSLPRSGTTWCQEIVHSLLRLDRSDAEVDAESVFEKFPFLELTLGAFSPVSRAEKLKEPRTIKSHLPYDALPESIKTQNAKIIYICRNPKDFAVGLYNFHRTWPYANVPDEYRFKHFLRSVMNDKTMYAPIFPHLLGFWRRRDDANILFLKYEDLHEDLPKAIGQIAEFIGMPTLTESELQRVTARATVDRMRATQEANGTYTGGPANSFIRKGTIGDWKNYFGKDKTSRQYDKWIRKNLAGTGLQFRYE